MQTLVCTKLYGTAPHYWSSLLRHYEPPRHLRSTDRRVLSVPHTCISTGSRGFRHSAPSFWNNLPDSLRSTDTYSSFRSHLRTCLFREIWPLAVSRASVSFSIMRLCERYKFNYKLLEIRLNPISRRSVDQSIKAYLYLMSDRAPTCFRCALRSWFNHSAFSCLQILNVCFQINAPRVT